MNNLICIMDCFKRVTSSLIPNRSSPYCSIRSNNAIYNKPLLFSPFRPGFTLASLALAVYPIIQSILFHTGIKTRQDFIHIKNNHQFFFLWQSTGSFSLFLGILWLRSHLLMQCFHLYPWPSALFENINRLSE